MREKFLAYAKEGAMTREELANVLKVTERWVGERVRSGKIPVIEGTRPYRFDADKMIKLFCDTPTPTRARSLTTEKRNSRGNQNGGFRKCL